MRKISARLIYELIPDEPIESIEALKASGIQVPVPEIASHSVLFLDNELRFDFLDNRSVIEVTDGRLFYVTEQRILDLDVYRKEWIDAEFIYDEEKIKDGRPVEDVESRIYDLIKYSGQIESIYIDMDVDNDNSLPGVIILHDFVLKDENSDDEIDMLKKKKDTLKNLPEWMDYGSSEDKDLSSYSLIYRETKFIRMEDRYIPLIFVVKPRDEYMPTPGYWTVATHFKEQYLFTEDELRSTFSGWAYSGPRRNGVITCHADFFSWLMSGVSESLTMEEAIAEGLQPILKVEQGKLNDTLNIEFSSITEFYYLLNEYSDKILDISLVTT